MKRLLTKTVFLASLIAFTISAQADDRWETLRAINWVENPTNHTRIGRFGELGPYQFRPATWRMHTRKPFSMAVQREAADEVAVKHYEWIKASLEKAGVDATPFNIAMAWNTGVTNVINGRAPTVSFNYAERVVNLVHTLKAQEPGRGTTPEGAATSTVLAAVMPVTPLSLDKPMLTLSLVPNAPKFEINVAESATEPVVYTSRETIPAAQPAPLFVVSTTATLTPHFSVLPGLTD